MLRTLIAICALVVLAPPASANTWTLTPQQSPRPPSLQSVPMVYASGIDRMILATGWDFWGTNTATWAYDVVANQWTQLVSAANGITPARREYGMVYDSARSIVVAFGGDDVARQIRDETWILDLNVPSPRWALVTTTPRPAARWSFSMTYDASAGRVVLFGGLGVFGTSGVFLDDTWLFDTATLRWTQVFPATAPRPRDHFNFAYDPQHQVSILFGGHGEERPNGHYFADTWTYDARTNEWQQIFPTGPLPIGRDRGQLAYIGGGTVVLFGGKLNTDGSALGDTWTFNLDDNRWVERTPTPSPPAQQWPGMAYHPAHNIAVLWSNAAGDRVWTYRLATDAVPPSPPLNPRIGATGSRVIVLGWSTTHDQADSSLDRIVQSPGDRTSLSRASLVCVALPSSPADSSARAPP